MLRDGYGLNSTANTDSMQKKLFTTPLTNSLDMKSSKRSEISNKISRILEF